MVKETEHDTEAGGEAGSKQKIILASVEEFAEFGLSGARVDRIAKRAGINKAMIYYYYQSKEKLYRAAARQIFGVAAVRLKRRLDDAATLDEVLHEFADMHTFMFTTVPGFRAMALRELTKPDSFLLDEIASLLEQTGIPAALHTHIQEGMRAGSIRPIDGRQMMVAFISMSLGYHLISPMTDRVFKITDKQAFLEERKRAITDIFLNGVRTR